MNKRNGIVIAFVLLLLIGTGSFVFANPSVENNQKETNGNQNRVIEQKDDNSNYKNNNTMNQDLDDSQLNEDNNSGVESGAGLVQYPVTGTLVGTDFTDTAVVLPGGSNAIDNVVDSNDKKPDESEKPIPEDPINNPNDSQTNENDSKEQEAMVKKIQSAITEIEENMSQEVWDNVWNLVQQLPNGKQKDEFIDQLQTLRKDIDTLAYFQKLVSMVENASCRNDILDAITYNRDSELMKRINAFHEGSKKKEMLTKYASILKVLEDRDVPRISGIFDGAITDGVISFTIDDVNPVTISLDGTIVSMEQFLSKLGHGVHTLTFVDAAFLETIISFEVDTEKPIVQGITDSAYYKEGDVVQIDVQDDHDITYRLEKDGKIVDYRLGDVLTNDGTYTFVVADIVGNETEVYHFTIDTILPTAEVQYSTTSKTNGDVVATLVNESEEIKIINNDGNDTYVFTENGSFEFQIQDQAGNIGIVIAEVKNIDKIAPQYQDMGILNINHWNTSEDVTLANALDEVLVYVTFTEALHQNPTIQVNDAIGTMTLDTEHSRDDFFVYVYRYQVLDSDVGMISVKLFDYADDILNIGKELTNDDINSSEYPYVKVLESILDTGFHFEDGASFNTTEIVINRPNYDHMEVFKSSGKTPIVVNTNTYTIKTKNIRYTFVLYDKDGNEIDRYTMTHDGKAPVVKVNGVNSTSVSDEMYESVKLDVTDQDIQVVKRIFGDGSEQILVAYDPLDTARTSYSHEFVEGGNYHIVAVDRAGNETSVEFSITEKKLMLSAVLSLTEVD